MTDLNPTPNNRLIVDGVIGYGNVVFGAAVILAGLWASVEPLTWIGVFLVATGAALVAAQLIKRRRAERPAPRAGSEGEQS